ncbi:MAG TPA: ABC transporter ATP-binding protein [Fulvivirga sp.]|nr:ABC transporter ATP-binding protein [Fulvivirga sp.]
MSANLTILKTDNLSIGYKSGKKQSEVMSNINVELKRGQLVCFMGPNGVGKSTLIRTLIGAQKALAGKIFIEDKDFAKISAAELSKLVSVVLTDKINAGNMSVRELVTLGRYPHLNWSVTPNAADLKQIELAIDQAKVRPLENRKIYELSDGQLQKVMIARALCQDTPILILDEPTAHLDLNNRIEMINMLSDLAKETNKAILMATHELDLALQSADRIWLVGMNQPIINGFPEDLVLNGKIDAVFELKGFDLRTGRLEKKVGKGKVSLSGEGHAYLWTKNALERNGFEVIDDSEIQIKIKPYPLSWYIKNKGEHIVHTLENLIEKIFN